MGQVACVHCKAMVDASTADITGRGYRCAKCTVKSSIAASIGQNDVSDHLDPAERVARAKAAVSRIAYGACLSLGGVVLVVLPFPFHGFVAVGVFFAGLGTISHGILTRREMRGMQTH